MWPDLAKFRHFGKTSKVFGYSLRVYFVLAKILILIGQIFMILDQFTLLLMAKYWKDYLVIWSHWNQCRHIATKFSIKYPVLKLMVINYNDGSLVNYFKNCFLLNGTKTKFRRICLKLFSVCYNHFLVTFSLICIYLYLRKWNFGGDYLILSYQLF